jgi:hypothetical protein
MMMMMMEPFAMRVLATKPFGIRGEQTAVYEMAEK